MQGSACELNPLKVRYLMDSVYNLVTQPTHWSAMLQALCEAGQVSRSYIIVKSSESLQVGAYTAAPEDTKPYHAHCNSLQKKLFENQASGQSLQGQRVTEVPSYTRTESVCGVLSLHQSVSAVWSCAPCQMLWLGFHADPEDSTAALCAERAALLALTATHLATVLRVHAHMLVAQLRRVGVSSVLSCLPYAAVLVDARGAILEANTRAEATLCAGNMLQMTADRRLVASQITQQRALMEAFADAIQTQKIVHLSLDHDDPQHGQQLKMIPSGQLLCVEVHPCSQRSTSEAVERASVLYGVSAAERRVMHLLMDGMSAKDIASALGLTTGTVNQYTHRIFCKLKVHNQRELICLLRDGMSNVL